MKPFAILAMFLIPAIAHAQFGIAKAGPGSERAAEVKGRNAEQIPPPKRVQTYDEGCRKAIANNLYLWVWVGMPADAAPHDPRHETICQVDSLEGYPAKCVVLCRPDNDGELYWVRTQDAAGRIIEERGASRSASPFVSSSRQAYAERDDDGPWLGRAEQDRIKALWPASLEFPKGLKFYSLSRRYQRLYTMSSRPYRDIVPLEDGSLQFVHSGGLGAVDQSLWFSRKGLAVPDGSRIAVWQEYTDVRAFALTPRWRWQFPAGTVAVDALFNAEGKAFEIRTQTKKTAGWTTKVVHKDEDAAPRGYVGLRQSCASCHDYAEAVSDVPGRIYRHVIWGSDGRFSWRPFDDAGNIDNRWPIQVQ